MRNLHSKFLRNHRRLHYLKWIWCLINLQFFQICQPLISPSRFKANRWSQWWNRTHNIRRKYLWTSLGYIRVLWLHSPITVLPYYLWTFSNHVLFLNDLWSEPRFFYWKVVLSVERGLDFWTPSAVFETGVSFNLSRIVTDRLDQDLEGLLI